MKISQLKIKANNPRKIDQPQIEKLMQSIKDFPAMMELRPIVYDPITMEVLGGNQRLTACKKLGMKELPDAWVRSADSLTEDEKRRFVIQDNHQSGEWDFDLLSSDWADIDLVEMGIEIPDFENTIIPKHTSIEQKLKTAFEIVIELDNENELQKAFEKLSAEGYTCRISIL